MVTAPSIASCTILRLCSPKANITTRLASRIVPTPIVMACAGNEPSGTSCRLSDSVVACNVTNRVREAQDSAAADRVTVAAEGERTVSLARASAEATEAMGAAEAQAERARLAAQSEVAPQVLMALALRELAGNLPDIDQLVLTPDVVSSVLGRLAVGQPPATTTAREEL